VNKPLINENFVEIRIGKRIIKALVDSGSSTSIISSELFKQLGVPGQPLKGNQPSVLFSATNNKLRVEGKAEICLSFTGQTHCLFLMNLKWFKMYNIM